MSMNEVCIALTTCGSDTTARAMALDLVNHGFAASVSLQPVRTYSRFDGQTVDEEEVQLLVVTSVDRYLEVEARILRLHTYEISDVLMVRADACNEAALAWIRNSTNAFPKEPLS